VLIVPFLVLVPMFYVLFWRKCSKHWALSTGILFVGSSILLTVLSLENCLIGCYCGSVATWVLNS